MYQQGLAVHAPGFPNRLRTLRNGRSCQKVRGSVTVLPGHKQPWFQHPELTAWGNSEEQKSPGSTDEFHHRRPHGEAEAAATGTVGRVPQGEGWWGGPSRNLNGSKVLVCLAEVTLLRLILSLHKRNKSPKQSDLLRNARLFRDKASL